MNSLSSQYDLEIDKAIDEIKKTNAKRVLLHVPDGIKPLTNKLIEQIESEVKDVEILIWAGSCYGACDIPIEAKNVGVDLLIHWGHSRWKF